VNTAWNVLLERSQAMLAAARAGAFDRVIALESERHDMFAALPAVTDETRAFLNALIDSEREIAVLVDAERRRTAERLRDARRMHAGAGNYLGVAFGR
jgi:hypothetical protein